MDIWELLSRQVLGSLQVLLQQAIVLQISKQSYSFKKLLASSLIIRVITIILETNIIEFISPSSMIVRVVLQFGTFFLIFKQGWFQSALMSLGQILLTYCVEIIFQPIHIIFSSVIDVYTYKGQFFLRIFASILLLFIFLAVQKTKFAFSYELDQKKKNLLLLYFVFFFLFTMPNVISIEYNQIIPSSRIEIYNIALFVLFFIFNVMNLHNIYKITDITQQLETQELYIDTLEYNSRQLRSFKHDYDNVMNTIGSLIDCNDIDGLQKVRKELNLELLHVNNIDYINSQIENIPLLRGIVLAKASLAELNGVEFRLSIPCEIKLHYCRNIDFCRMIGILLDNALEAAMESTEKHMSLTVFHNRGIYRIEIRNSCKEDISIEQIKKDGYTTKLGHTGIGLHEVDSIVERYVKKGYEMHFDIKASNGTFTAQLTI